MARTLSAVLTAASSLLLVGTLAIPASAQYGTLGVGYNDPLVEKEDLVTGLHDPTALAVAPDGRVIFVQREGRINVWNQDGSTELVATLPVDAYERSDGDGDTGGHECNPDGRVAPCPAGFQLAEGGIHGILLAPDFDETGHFYLYYSPPDTLGQAPVPPKHPLARQSSLGDVPDEALFRLSRFTITDDNEIDLASEVNLFENPAELYWCCHYGGNMEWDPYGYLLLSVGDDTSSSFSSGYSPHDQREWMQYNNAGENGTSQNLADRRGKILRIDVQDIEGDEDLIPNNPAEGVPANPFIDNPDADPWVWALGFRSNYRFAVNDETGHMYVGVVGPDALYPDPNLGPAAHEEIETVPPTGGTNHGWPYCIGPNLPYRQRDFLTGQSLGWFDCDALGMTPASIYYTYAPSPAYVRYNGPTGSVPAVHPDSPYLHVAAGTNTVMGGTVYRTVEGGALNLPAVIYDNSLLWMEYSRDQIFRTPINADGTLDASPASLIPLSYGGVNSPIDAQPGPDGALYVMEYGGATWNSTNGKLSRFKCRGCTPDPNDYTGHPAVLDTTVSTVADVAAAGPATGASSLPVAGGIALVALVTAGLLRRRRTI